MLAYYDLRTMTWSLVAGVGIAIATLICHPKDKDGPLNANWGSLLAVVLSSVGAEGSELRFSFDGAVIDVVTPNAMPDR